MNSMAQQAVPNGNGQKELRAAQSSSVSNVVVTQLSPVISSIGPTPLAARSLPLVTGGHKVEELSSLPWFTGTAQRSPGGGPGAPEGVPMDVNVAGGQGDSLECSRSPGARHRLCAVASPNRGSHPSRPHRPG